MAKLYYKAAFAILETMHEGFTNDECLVEKVQAKLQSAAAAGFDVHEVKTSTIMQAKMRMLSGLVDLGDLSDELENFQLAAAKRQANASRPKEELPKVKLRPLEGNIGRSISLRDNEAMVLNAAKFRQEFVPASIKDAELLRDWLTDWISKTSK